MCGFEFPKKKLKIMLLSSNRVQARGSETRCVVGCLGAWEIEGSLTHVLPLGQGLLARLHRVGNMGLPLGQVVSLGVVHSVGALPREVGNHEEGVEEVSDLREEHPGEILSDTCRLASASKGCYRNKVNKLFEPAFELGPCPINLTKRHVASWGKRWG